MKNKSEISHFITAFFSYVTGIVLPIYIIYNEYLFSLFVYLSIFVLLAAAITKQTTSGLIVRNLLAWLIVFSMPIITYGWEYYNEEILGLVKEDTYFGGSAEDI